MASPRPTELSAEGVRNLQDGISLLLSRWDALQIAVENQWGGPHTLLKSQQLAGDIFNWLTQSLDQLYIDDLEDKLDDFMLTLNTEVEDGSIDELALELMTMHEECLDGNYQSIERLKEPIPPRVPPVRQVTREDGYNDQSLDDDIDSSEMAVDGSESQSSSNHKDMRFDNPRPSEAARPRPNEAAEMEDGWTVVSSKRNKGRK